MPLVRQFRQRENETSLELCLLSTMRQENGYNFAEPGLRGPSIGGGRTCWYWDSVECALPFCYLQFDSKIIPLFPPEGADPVIPIQGCQRIRNCSSRVVKEGIRNCSEELGRECVDIRGEGEGYGKNVFILPEAVYIITV